MGVVLIETERIALNEAGPESSEEKTGSSPLLRSFRQECLAEPRKKKSGADNDLLLTSRPNGRPLSSNWLVLHWQEDRRCSTSQGAAVRQDLHAASLLCNLESLLTRPAPTARPESTAEDQPPKQFNRADAYQALKAPLLPLLDGDRPAEKVVQKLPLLFLARPISVPADRKVSRRKPSFHRSYHFQRHVKTSVF